VARAGRRSVGPGLGAAPGQDTRIARSLSRVTGSAWARIDGALSAEPEAPPAPDGGSAFTYPVWSRDGARLAGILQQPSGRRNAGLVLPRVEEVPRTRGGRGDPAAWTGADKTLLFLRSGALFAADAASGAEHEVTTPRKLGGSGAAGFIYIYALSRDQRSLLLVLWRNQADNWQATLP
jgi:hypothetical protein